MHLVMVETSTSATAMTVAVEENYPRGIRRMEEQNSRLGGGHAPGRRKQVPLEGEVWMKVDPLALQIYGDVMRH